MENINNFLKFELNDNLKKFITEVNYKTPEVHYDADEIESFIQKWTYEIILLDIWNGIDMVLHSCKCVNVVNADESIDIHVKFHDCSSNGGITLDGINQLTLKAEAIVSGKVKFINSVRDQDQTDMFIALVSAVNTVNTQYKFNVDAFLNLPMIDHHKFFFIRTRNNNYKSLFTLVDMSDSILKVADPSTGSYYHYTPLQLLTGRQSYPLNEIQQLDRNENGLLIPKIDRIIPIKADFEDND